MVLLLFLAFESFEYKAIKKAIYKVSRVTHLKVVLNLKSKILCFKLKLKIKESRNHSLQMRGSPSQLNKPRIQSPWPVYYNYQNIYICSLMTKQHA